MHVHVDRRRKQSHSIPNCAMMSNNHAAKIDPQNILSSEEAVKLFEEDGGHLTYFRDFGVDPLSGDEKVTMREATFHARYPTFEPFFHRLVNGDDSLFKEGLLFFVHLTNTMI